MAQQPCVPKKLLTCTEHWHRWFVFQRWHMQAYLRRTQRYLNGKLTDTLDFGAVEVQEEFQGRGYFTRLLTNLEQQADEHGLVVYVESLLNFRLYLFLRNRGYVELPCTRPPCMYRNKPGEL